MIRYLPRIFCERVFSKKTILQLKGLRFMFTSSNVRLWCAGLLALAPLGVARADDPATSKPATSKPAAQPAAEEPGINLLDAARSGSVVVEAEGTGDGRMMIKVTNQTNRKLKVVLPPGLVASGATGQMGGMGGMGGGMGGMGGGMGGMGGGMGGMGGGMGGMGGGGMGGGMGGNRGGQGGGGGGGQQLTMPPTMGLMLVGRLIMSLVEPTESWNPASLMMGMMGMGGMGMGGMGGGMGGGMMGGGMGGGFRSIPPTDLPNATLNPGQSRGLSTRIVSLNGPDAEGGVSFPAKGEPLTIGDVSQLDANPMVQKALRRLATDKAPETVSQLVLWAAAGMSWNEIALISKSWANPQELALAKQLIADLDTKAVTADTGRLLIEVTAKDVAQKGLAGELNDLFRSRTMLGLTVEGVVPARPTGPAVACKVQLSGTVEKPEASIQVATTDALGTSWTQVGKFNLAVARDDAGKAKAEAFGDSLAEEMIKRLVKVTVKKTSAASGGLIPAGPKAKDLYTIRVENYSSLLLNGIAVTGEGAKPSEPAKVLLGISLSPRRTFSVPATGESVERFGLKQGIKVVALDLSGL
jgi:hypothetical protein